MTCTVGDISDASEESHPLWPCMLAFGTSDIGSQAKPTGCWRMHLPCPGRAWTLTWRQPDGMTQADILVWQPENLKWFKDVL